MIDTHTHIYDEAFADDAAAMVQRALDAGVTHAFLPNVDASTIASMRNFAAAYPSFCSMMMGIHPTSVNANYKAELAAFDSEITRHANDYIGNCGSSLIHHSRYNWRNWNLCNLCKIWRYKNYKG